jgi:hypothetical protein
MTILQDLGASFIITAIEKRHVATTKLADTLLDSGTNRAVSNLHYGARGLRLMLAAVIVELATPQDQEEFWQVYAEADPVGLSRILNRFLVRFKAVPGVQARLRELMSDALAWGAEHPQDLLDFQRSELDSPNLIAVSLLMDGLHDSLKGTGLKIGRFVHDEQQQFGRFIKMWYQLGRRFTLPKGASAFSTELRTIDTYRCEIEMLPSKEIAGLQLIDVVLWLYRRSIGNMMRDFPGCAALVDLVITRARIRYHSKEQLLEDAQSAYDEIMQRPIGAKAL